jgi:CDGSH-type Zn-finger protein
MPYCDNAHVNSGWIGDEVAITDGPFGRDMHFYGPDGLVVTKHSRLCMNSGFCVLKNTDFTELTEQSADPDKKARVIKMIEDCPSGSLTYITEANGPDIEPELPQQIIDTFECTQYGEIRGPFWITGYVPIERADGEGFTPRNRVTLCNCGHSRIKPLCDGTHRPLQENKLRRKLREEREAQEALDAQNQTEESGESKAQRIKDQLNAALKNLRDSFRKDDE